MINPVARAKRPGSLTPGGGGGPFLLWWRRLLAAVAALALLSLSGCDVVREYVTEAWSQELELLGLGPEVEPTVVTFAAHDYELDDYEALAGDFHRQNPDVRVELVSLGEPTVIFTDTDPLATLAGVADTFVGSSLMVGPTAPSGVVVDLTGRSETDESFDLPDVYPAALTAMRRHDRLWGLPLTLNLRLVFYNRALFERAGVPLPEIGWSWDDFLYAAVALTDRQEGEVVRYGYVDPMALYTMPTISHRWAGPLVTSGGSPVSAPQVDLTGAQAAAALDAYADLVLAHEVTPPPAVASAAALATDETGAGYRLAPAMWAGASFELDTFRTKYGDVGAVPFPGPGAPDVDVVARAVFISAQTAHPEAAWRWAAFLTRQAPGRFNDTVPARASVAAATRFWARLDPEVETAYRYALNHPVVFPRPLYGSLYWAFEAVLDGADASTALAIAEAQVRAALAPRPGPR